MRWKGFALTIALTLSALPADGYQLPLATPQSQAEPRTLNIADRPEVQFVPAEIAEVSLYSPGEALRWAAQTVFAPFEARRTKLLYQYSPEDCHRFDWSNLDQKWGDDQISLAFIRPQEASDLALGKKLPMQLWSVTSSRLGRENRPVDLLGMEGPNLCRSAKVGGYQILLDAPLPIITARSKFIAKTLVSGPVVVSIGVTFHLYIENRPVYTAEKERLESELSKAAAAKLNEIFPLYQFSDGSKPLMANIVVIEHGKTHIAGFKVILQIKNASGEEAVFADHTVAKLGPTERPKEILESIERMLRKNEKAITSWVWEQL